jgi:hypothetical protein
MRRLGIDAFDEVTTCDGIDVFEIREVPVLVFVDGGVSDDEGIFPAGD